MAQAYRHFSRHCGSCACPIHFFGIQPSDLEGWLNGLMAPILYVVAGFLIGFAISGGIRLLNIKATAKSNEEDISYQDLANKFVSIPFALKAFLKTIVIYGAAYRKTNDIIPWENYLNYLKQFVIEITLQNNVSKFVLNDQAERMFDQYPALLMSVPEAELAKHAVRGTEGVCPSVFTTEFLWWYYTDDEDVPAPVGMIGFFRQPPMQIIVRVAFLSLAQPYRPLVDFKYCVLFEVSSKIVRSRGRGQLRSFSELLANSSSELLLLA